MKVLILDDSDYKIKHIQDALLEWKVASDVMVARSFQKGLSAIKSFSPDLILLDMTLPTSEREDGVLTGRTRIFGGQELLHEMALDDIIAKVIVLTQFDRFGEPPNSFELGSLIDDLRLEFPNLVIGGIYYSNVDSKWRDQLWRLINVAIKK